MTALTSQTTFCQFTLAGAQAGDFLQGQLTADVGKINSAYTQTAICNLKGRVDFGLWVARQDQDGDFTLVLAQDVAGEFAAHVKKYGAFSKITLSDTKPCFVALVDDTPTFSSKKTGADASQWLAAMLYGGQSIITASTRGLYQPQELRLHQLGGVHYDKGCYLGQEVVARLWFKAAPKAWLHLVKGVSDAPEVGASFVEQVQVVNSLDADDGFLALVVARPEALADANLTVLDLPDLLNGSVAKE